MTEAEQEAYIVVGRISGVYGVRGWVKVYSHTQPRTNILSYGTWYLRGQNGWQEVMLKDGKSHGKGVIAQLEGCDDRDQALALRGRDIAIRREQLAETGANDYYWDDLIGLDVVTETGVELGTVHHLFETGANDVLVIRGERERLIPYIPEQVIVSIDLEAGRIVVDWDPEF